MNSLLANWKPNSLLLVTAAIWGFAFTAQKAGLDHIGPFTFNAARFIIGSITLVPIIVLVGRFKKSNDRTAPAHYKILLNGGWAGGLILFLGMSMQQVGLQYTEAGKAGFLTGFYVVLVPVLGLLWKQKTGLATWMGIALAIAGLCFLSIKDDFSISKGDFLVICSTVFWASLIQLVALVSPKVPSLHLAFLQVFVAAVLSSITAIIMETILMTQIYNALLPLAYVGILSTAVAFTLQFVAQKKAHPTHAALIMSLETVFAVLGGWIILHESLSLRSLIGCTLMLAGIILSQLFHAPRVSVSKATLGPIN